MLNKYLIIVAGGYGKRMGSHLPKQFLLINNRPILMHTFDAFSKCNIIDKFILVLPKNEIEYWNDLCQKHCFTLNHEIAFGGKTRAESVKNGLQKIDNENALVAIHDGVRPIVSQRLINEVFEKAEIKKNAIPVVPVTDSLRFIDENINKTIDRNKVYRVQTPQCFYFPILKNAYKSIEYKEFTDDASLVESCGIDIELCEGDINNIKITNYIDLILCENLLK